MWFAPNQNSVYGRFAAVCSGSCIGARLFLAQCTGPSRLFPFPPLPSESCRFLGPTSSFQKQNTLCRQRASAESLSSKSQQQALLTEATGPTTSYYTAADRTIYNATTKTGSERFQKQFDPKAGCSPFQDAGISPCRHRKTAPNGSTNSRGRCDSLS